MINIDKKIPVIIDCDPGIDDALALFLAISSNKLDIRAITAVAGNVPLEHTGRNALMLLELANSDIKVAQGATDPIIGERETAEGVHGEAGLGTVILPEPKKAFYEKDAYETIYEEAIACDGELRLIVLGPQTNIAIALEKYPDLKDMIHSITIMGGGVEAGNVTEYAEFNIYADPEAARRVFESGIPINMIGLDATHKALISNEDVEEIGTYGNPVSKVAYELLKFIQPVYKGFNFPAPAMHDPLTVAYLIDESLVEAKKCYVYVDDSKKETRGQTVADLECSLDKEANAFVGLDTDNERFIKLLKEAIKSFDYLNN